MGVLQEVYVRVGGFRASGVWGTLSSVVRRAGFKIPLRRDPKSPILEGVEPIDAEKSKPKTFQWIQGLGLELFGTASLSQRAVQGLARPLLPTHDPLC